VGVILGLYMGILESAWGVLWGLWESLEGGLGKCSGEGPAEGAEGRLKGCGGA
jgi:hypothetical protein